jgi:hypothetical protein
LAYPLLRNRLGSVVAVACLWAGCFTDPINMRPSVRIETPNQPTFRGEPVSYPVIASDPDGDALTLTWARTPDDCPADFDAPEMWPKGDWKQVTELDQKVPGVQLPAKDTLTPYCVWVVAKDRFGATSIDARSGEPLNRAPVVSLELVDSPAGAVSFPLHMLIQLSAANSRDPDGDMLGFAWTLTPPPSSMAQLATCKVGMLMEQTDRCLNPDVPGDYVVQVDVSDGQMGKTTVTKTLHVPPGPLGVPRIDLVSPAGPGPYALGSLFQVSGARSTGDGPDLPGVHWTGFETPPGSNATTTPCNEATSQCFTADVPGTYRIGLTVSDEAGDSAPVWATYTVVPDQPPCIEHTTPDIAEPLTTASRFIVDTVFDDLDPYPSVANMQWFVSDGGGPFMPVEKDFPSYTLNQAAFPFGDVVSVRLEIHDRDLARSAKAFLACGDNDVCTAANLLHPDTCFQRLTWKVHILPP